MGLYRLLAPLAFLALASAATSFGQPAPAAKSDYASRVVAFLEGGEVVTRQDLGDYLLARMGAARLENLLKRKLIEHAAREARVEVTDAEVEAAFVEALQGVPREKFIKEVVKGHYGLTVFEWKEDRLKPKLWLLKMCRGQLRHTEDEVRREFESTYGEKVQVRMILFEKDKVKAAQDLYATLRDSEEAFAEAARLQKVRGDLASSGGKIKPISRYSFNEDVVEKTAFALKPGQVSELFDTPEGIMVLKCDGRIPADPTVNLEAKRDELVRQVLDKKLQAEIPRKMKELTDRSPFRVVVTDWTARAEPGQVVARMGQGVPVTREEFAEYLIARFGAEKLDGLVSWRIIQRVCKEKNLTVTDKEIDAALDAHVKKYNATPGVFEEKILKPAGSSLYEFREDFLRPELLMTKLVRPQVKATDDEVKLAYDAYHGERVECRMILYPRGEERVAMQEYAQLRDSEEAFAKRAKSQANSRLAAIGGKLPPIGRNTTGNPELEREMFSLNPGEVSRLVGAPEGTVLVKCDRRLPADATVKLADVRAKLEEEVVQRKVRIEIPRVFAEMRKTAGPRLLLKDPNKVEDIATTVGDELQRAGFVAPMKP